VRCGVEATGRGGKKDMVFGSGRCVVSPGWGSIRGSSKSRAAYSTTMRWREEGEAKWRASRIEITRCSWSSPLSEVTWESLGGV
jgi:hypothetical protein